MLLLLAHLASAGPTLGADLGLALSPGHLGAGPLLRVTGGLDPGWLGGRLSPTVSLEVTTASRKGTFAPPETAAPVDWEARTTVFDVSPGARLRALGPSEPISPFVDLGPTAGVLWARSEGESAGAAVSPTAEARFAVGLRAVAGLEVKAGDAVAELRLGYAGWHAPTEVLGPAWVGAGILGLGVRWSP